MPHRGTAKLTWLLCVCPFNLGTLQKPRRDETRTRFEPQTTVNELYETCLIKKTRDILKDTSHPLHEFYYAAQSGSRYISERVRTNRYRTTFLPASVTLLNAKSGRGK